MELPSAILCVHPLARGALVAVLIIGLLHFLLLRLRLNGAATWALVAYSVLMVFVLWLGWYHFSPLGFGTTRQPLLRGFVITKPQRPPQVIRSGQVVTVGRGAAMGIQSLLLAGPASCIWSSSTGGAFDDPNSCDTAYVSGQGAQYDVLRVHISSACKIPPASGEIQIGILP